MSDYIPNRDSVGIPQTTQTETKTPEEIAAEEAAEQARLEEELREEREEALAQAIKDAEELAAAQERLAGIEAKLEEEEALMGEQAAADAAALAKRLEQDRLALQAAQEKAKQEAKEREAAVLAGVLDAWWSSEDALRFDASKERRIELVNTLTRAAEDIIAQGEKYPSYVPGPNPYSGGTAAWTAWNNKYPYTPGYPLLASVEDQIEKASRILNAGSYDDQKQRAFEVYQRRQEEDIRRSNEFIAQTQANRLAVEAENERKKFVTEEEYKAWLEEQDSDSDGIKNVDDPAPYRADISSIDDYEAYFADMRTLQSTVDLEPTEVPNYFGSSNSTLEALGLAQPPEILPRKVYADSDFDPNQGLEYNAANVVSPTDYNPANLYSYDTDGDGISDAAEIGAQRVYGFQQQSSAYDLGLPFLDTWTSEEVFGTNVDGSIDLDYHFDLTGEELLSKYDWQAANMDIDGDGVNNIDDAFVYLATEWEDVDGDRLGDNEADDDVTTPDPNRIDTDGDGVFDIFDALPNDPREFKDSDGDGVGDNSDYYVNDADRQYLRDSDNDGIDNRDDAFPNDPKEYKDSDGDGIGDNFDYYPDNPDLAEKRDADGDGVEDSRDAFPYDPDKFRADQVEVVADDMQNPSANTDTVEQAEIAGAIKAAEKTKEYSERFYMHNGYGGYNHQNTEELKEILGITDIAKFDNGDALETGTNAILYQGYERPLTVDELWSNWQRIMDGSNKVLDPRAAEIASQGSMSGNQRLIDYGKLAVGSQPFVGMSGVFGNVGYVWDNHEYTYTTNRGEERTADSYVVNAFDFHQAVGGGDNPYSFSEPGAIRMLQAGATPIIFDGYYNVLSRAAQLPKLYDFNMSGTVPSTGLGNVYRPIRDSNEIIVYYSSKEAAENNDQSKVVEVVRNRDAMGNGLYLERKAKYKEAAASGTARTFNMAPDVYSMRNEERRRRAADQYVKDHSQGVLWEAGAVSPGQAISFDIQTGENPDGSAISLLEGFETKYNFIAETEDGVPIRAEDPTAGLIRGADVIPKAEDVAEAYFMIRSPAFGIDGSRTADIWLASLDPVLQELFHSRDFYNPSEKVIDDLISTVGATNIIGEGGLARVDPEKVKSWSDGFKGTEAEKKSAKELSDALTSYHAGEYLEFGALSIILDVDTLAEIEFEADPPEVEEGTFVGKDTLLNELARSNAIIGLQDAWSNPEAQHEYQNLTSNEFRLEQDRQIKYAIERSAPYTLKDSAGRPVHEGLSFNSSAGSLGGFVAPNVFGTSDGYPTIIQSLLFEDKWWIQAFQSSVVGRFEPPMYMDVPEENQAQLWPGGEDSDERWRDTSRLYMKLPSAAPVTRYPALQPGGDFMGTDDPTYVGSQFDLIAMDGPYQAYKKAIEEGKTEAQAQAAAAAVPNPNDQILATWASMGEDRSERRNQFLGAVDESVYSDGGWDISSGGWPTDLYAQNAPDGGVWIDISNGMAPIGAYTMMYIAQAPEEERVGGWSSPVGKLFSTALAVVSPATYLVSQGIRAANGETLKTGDWITIVTAGLKVGGKLKAGGTKAEAEAAGEAARDEAIAKSGNLDGQALAGVGDAAYAAEYTTVINGVGIAGLTAKQTVALINVAGGGDVGTALLTSFGPDYLEKGFSNLGVDTSFYTNMSQPVKDGFNVFLAERLNGNSFSDSLRQGGVEFFAEYISDNDLVDEVKLIVDSFIDDLGPAISAVGDLFNESQLSDALDAVLSLVPEGVVEELSALLTSTGEAIDPILDLAEAGIDLVEDVIIEPLSDLVSGISTRVDLAVNGVVNLFPDGLPEAIDEQITAIVDGLSGASKTSFEKLPEASKKALETSVAQLVVNGEIDNQGLETAFTKELITAETVNDLIDSSEGKTKDVLMAIGPGALTTAMRASINMGLAGGSVSGAFIQTIATATANALKYAADAGGIEGLTREISQFQDNISGQQRRVEEAAAEVNSKDEEMAVKVLEIEAITTDIEAQRARLSELYGAAIAEGATEGDRVAFENYQENFASTLPSLQMDINNIKGELADIEDEYEVALGIYNDNIDLLEQYSRDTDPKLQLEFSNMHVAVANQLNQDFGGTWQQYAQVNGLGEDATITDVAEHYISQGYVNSVPTTVEDYNARINLATNAFVDNVVADAGINLAELPPNSRADIRAAILNEVSTFAGVEGVTPLQMLETMQDDLTYRDGFKAGTEFDDVILQAYNQSYITDDGEPLNFTSLAEVENYEIEQRANQFINAYLPIDINTGAPVDPEEYSKYLTDLIEGRLFVAFDESGMYSWDEATQTIKFNALTGLQEVVDVAPGKTLSQMAAEDPIFYVQTLGEIEDNAAAVNLVAKVQEETGETFEIPDYSDTVFGTPDSELPWIVRVSRDYMRDIAVTRQEYLDKVEELESFEGPLTAEQESELEETRGAYETADRQLMTAYNVINVGGNVVGAYNTIYQTFGVAGQEGRARKEGEKAMLNAIQQGMDTEEAKELGAKVTEELLNAIDYSTLTGNELNRTLTMLEGAAKGFVSEAYTKEVDEMYARWDEAETFGEGVAAVFGSIAATPRAFWNEIIIQELGETAIQLATSGGLGVVTKEVAKRQADNILANMTSAQIGTGVYTASVAQDVMMEYAQNVEEVYGTTMSLFFTRDEYVNPPQYIVDQGEDAVQTYREGLEQEYNQVAFDTSVNAGTFAMATVLATLPFEGGLDKLLSKKFFGDVGLDTLELVAEDTNLLQNTVGDYLSVIGKESFAEGVQEGLTVGYAENAYYNLGFTDRPAAAEVGVALTVGSIADAGATAIIAPIGYPTPQAEVASQINDPLGRILVTSNEEVYQAIESGNVPKVSELLTTIGLATVIPLNIEILNATDDSYILTPNEVVAAYEGMGLEPPEGFVDTIATQYIVNDETGEVTVSSPVTDSDTLEQQLAEQWELAFPSDADGDGVPDRTDAFPDDPAETVDTDADGVGDNADAFPADPAETLDSDSDGVGDNTDVFPTDASEYIDTDADGMGDNADELPNDPLYTTEAAFEDANDMERLGKHALVADIDGDGIVDALSDGLLFLRHSFGMRGDELIEGLIKDDSIRNTAKEVEEYLSDPRVQQLYDFNKDGQIDSLTDGLAFLRAAFGIHGDELTEGLLLPEDDAVQVLDNLVTATHSAFALDADGLPTDELKNIPAPAGAIHNAALTAPELTDTDAKNALDDLAAYSYDELNALTYSDTDADGVVDADDAFPQDATETLDSDGDGVGNNTDPLPNDGSVYDQATYDTFYADQDNDGDGVRNADDVFPYDPTETIDTDADGVGDNADFYPQNPNRQELQDADGDAVDDRDDAFPNDASETTDTDADGVGDNADVFPQDATETIDTDADGVGDNADVFPQDATETIDTDADGVGDNTDIRPTDPDVFDEASYEAGLDTKDSVIAEQKDALEATSEILGKEANEVTQEDIDLVTDYLAGVELAQDKIDTLMRYDVTGQDNLVTQDDLALLTQAYTLGDYTGFDPDADFNPATGMYLTAQEKQAEIDALQQAELDREAEFEQQLEAELAQKASEVTSDIQTQVQTGVEELAKEEEEKRKTNFLESLTAPGRKVDVETPDPAVIQYEYDISGDSIFATPDQEAAYEQRSPYALQDSQDNPYGDSLISKIQGRLQKQQGLASGGAVKNKTNEILRILGER